MSLFVIIGTVLVWSAAVGIFVYYCVRASKS